MRLKKLIVFGFKSFAEKTTFDFSEGITGIVGPNGCGKSNIVDAFRWVMGESSAKAIRGQKMPDVLFNGTQKRKNSPFAEVTLVFTDVKESLNVEYEEVAISRRLGRDGQSDYFLNKKNVRLKDLHELFSGTGIGKGGFWIFEQGKIDQVIQWSPQERRIIFEEAAGISGYLLKKKEALSRLRETQNNYDKIQERRGEQERLLEHLKKQADEASKFHDKKKQLEKLEHTYFFHQADQLEQKKEELEEQLKKFSTKDKEQELKLAQQALGKKKEELAHKEIHREEVKESLLSLQHQIDYLQKDVKRLYISSESLDRREESLNKEIHTLQQNAEKEKESLVTLKKQKELTQLNHEQKREEVEKMREEILTCEVELDTIQNTIKGHDKEKLEALHQKHQLITKQREAEYRKETIFSQIKKLKNQISETTELIDQEKKREQELKSTCEANEEKYLKKAEQFQKLLEEIDALKEEKESKERHIITLTRKRAEVEAKQDSLLSLKRQKTNISKATKELYQLNEDKKSPFYQKITPLCEILKIPKDLTASLKKAEQIDTEKLIHELVVCDPDKEHFWITPDGLICHTIEKKHHVIAREGEINELEKELKLLEKELSECKISIEMIDIKSLEEKKKQEDKTKQELKWSLRENKHLLDKLLLDIEKFHKQQKTRNEELALLQNTVEKDQNTNISLTKELKEQEALLEEKEKLISTLQEDFDDKKTSYIKRKEHFLIQEREFSTVNQALHQITQQVALIEMKEKERENLETRCTSEFEEILHKKTQNKNNIDSNNVQLQSLEEDSKKQTATLSQAKDVVDTLKSEVLTQETLVHNLIESIQKLNQEISTLKIRLTEVDLKLNHIIEEVFDKYQIEINELSPSLDNYSLEQMEKKIHSLKRYMQSTDSINFAAIEDYEKEKEISGDLEGQLKDIESALHEIQEVIQHLDKESRKRFKETFETISEHFTAHFQKLFGGGNASLTLLEGEDLLNSGIDIHVEPPGKNLRSIQLLSGGEKCLTAIALLLALFQVKPAPMCLLDEIDAPLDDVNVKRFLEMIAPFSEKTQTIIITHNKLTMEKADKLLGVSMEEKGVSKVLSLSFAKTSQTLELQQLK